MDIQKQAVNEYLTKGFTYRQLAEKYGVSRSTINRWVLVHQGHLYRAYFFDSIASATRPTRSFVIKGGRFSQNHSQLSSCSIIKWHDPAVRIYAVDKISARWCDTGFCWMHFRMNSNKTAIKH